MRGYEWVGSVLSSDARAMGVYLAVLYLEIREPPTLSWDSVYEGLRDLHLRYLAGRPDAGEALEASRAFVEVLASRGFGKLGSEERRRLLGEVERALYRRLEEAFARYLRLDRVPEDSRRDVGVVLSDVRRGAYGGGFLPYSRTFAISEDDLLEGVAGARGFGRERAAALLRHLGESGLALVTYRMGYRHYFFPAPSLSDGVLRLLVGETERVSPPGPPGRPELAARPTREVLESVVASTLEDLGFAVSTNTRRGSRSGVPVEVDVWAEKRVFGSRFSVYVSCKNWNRAVGRPVVDEEMGRVSSLMEVPHLKILVAKELTDDARRAAEASGFVVVELGEKAEAGNAAAVYDALRSHLSRLFTSAAPPVSREVAEAASRVTEAAESLKRALEELLSLLRG